MEIRTETSNDIEAIRGVIADAFGQDHEAKLVDDLRDAGDLVVSLITELDGIRTELDTMLEEALGVARVGIDLQIVELAASLDSFLEVLATP